MTKNKDLKRRGRARMKKTGESYTAARTRVVTPLGEVDLAERAGMRDEAVRAKTGMDWRGWVAALDALDAAKMSHRDIAKLVRDRWPDIGGWWAQSITVGYERIRGLRDVGSDRKGRYAANKSRTFHVPVSALYRAFSEKRRRVSWLGELPIRIRTSTKHKSMRITWPDGTSVHAYFDAKGDAKSTVSIQHVDLGSRDDVERAKAEWTARLDALAAAL